MKTSILTATFLFLSVFLLNAQNSSDKNPFEGIWQMYIPTDGNPVTENQQTGELSLDSSKIKPGYSYKFFSKDGYFTTLFATPVVSRITIMGTYEVLSPGVYVEHVKEHTNPAYANRDTELAFQFLSDDVFVMSYENEFGNRVFEAWKQVIFGSPREELMKHNNQRR